MPLENSGRIIKITRKKDTIKIDFSIWDSLLVNEENFTDDYYYVGKELTRKEYNKLVDSLNDPST